MSIQFQDDDSGWHDSPLPQNWWRICNPKFRCRPLSIQGIDAGLWDATAGQFEWRYTDDELVFILAGAVFVREMGDKYETLHRLDVGDSMQFPAGTRWQWTVQEYVRKFYVITPRKSLLRRIFNFGKRL
jgi:uncharacterized cupin superfamily protein